LREREVVSSIKLTHAVAVDQAMGIASGRGGEEEEEVLES